MSGPTPEFAPPPPVKTAPDLSIPALEGLRGFACLLVVLTHAGGIGWYREIVPMGQLGVMLFFTLSGFLMAWHYTPGKISWRYWLAFFIRRFFRVYPAFMLIALGIWIEHRLYFWVPGTNSPALINWNMLASIWSLKLLPLTVPPYWFWTVPFEMRFYLIFPFIALALLWLPLVSVSKAIFTACVWLALLYLGNHRIFYPAFYPFILFFIGGIAAGLLYREILSHSIAGYSDWNLMALFSCLAILFVIHNKAYNVYLWPGNIWFYAWFLSPLMVMTVLSVALATNTIKWFFSNIFMRFVGRISYSLYLLHPLILAQGIIDIRPKIFHHVLSFTEGLVLTFAIAMLMAYASYRLIEKPFNRIGKKLSLKIEPQ